MRTQAKNIDKFLENIPDEKLRNFADRQHTLYECYNAGFRLDHQGLNDDPNEKPFVHRLYVQPIGGSGTKSKSKRAKANKKNDSVTARCHVSNKATPQEIRDALLESYYGKGLVLAYAPPK
ncbi:hypothetical protein PFICI_02225 [Pestalotiopsis fici W106-1]|uniref:Uncharacterized protein n=1 Tax=Pestalotiopsis fici (strain W106-1 / CGMCC3.15140) TaxID=1229662 RepID=W3XDS2_PESFW|nr:uncharacterized protein PFICI_02225 [Pestalotiopsis fici W106-1]ETS84200.1 hypothetical protein PFICI_02225 [Pestalotiopsis fici W106-1]